jgi:hypothetical protein
MSQAVYFINGREVTAEEFRAGAKSGWLDAPPMTANTYRAHDPLVSDGIGCLKSQVPELRETIRQHNIQGVAVKDSGQLEITSRRGRKELLAVRGLIDSDGGYLD